MAFALPVAACLAALWLTGWFRQYALAQRMIDVPNARSSHDSPTPRGGGMAIVVATLIALIVAGMLNLLDWRLVCGLVGGGALTAGIGFADDHRPLARRWRLLGHFIAAVWVLVWLDGLPAIPVSGRTLGLGWAGHTFAALYLVWLINLTNFMDGIDGIAATEAITVASGAAFITALVVRDNSQWLAPLILAASSLGFLVWNWPPARIFMGDGGSGFVGLMLGALSLEAAHRTPPLFWSWVILLGVFIVDATITLVRRTIRSDRVYEAHRTHAYQHAAQRFGAHRPVTVVVAVINVVWLLPLAALVARGSLQDAVGVAIAYVPLLVVAVKLGAGIMMTDHLANRS